MSIEISNLNCVVAHSNLFISSIQHSRYSNTAPHLFLSLKFIHVKSGSNSLIVHGVLGQKTPGQKPPRQNILFRNFITFVFRMSYGKEISIWFLAVKHVRHGSIK